MIVSTVLFVVFYWVVDQENQLSCSIMRMMSLSPGSVMDIMPTRKYLAWQKGWCIVRNGRRSVTSHSTISAQRINIARVRRMHTTQSSDER